MQLTTYAIHHIRTTRGGFILLESLLALVLLTGSTYIVI